MIALLIPFVQTLQVLCAELLLKKKEVQNSYSLRVTAMFYTILRSWKNSEKKLKRTKEMLWDTIQLTIYEIPQEGIVKDLGQEICLKLSKQLGNTGCFFQ